MPLFRNVPFRSDDLLRVARSLQLLASVLVGNVQGDDTAAEVVIMTVFQACTFQYALLVYIFNMQCVRVILLNFFNLDFIVHCSHASSVKNVGMLSCTTLVPPTPNSQRRSQLRKRTSVRFDNSVLGSK